LIFALRVHFLRADREPPESRVDLPQGIQMKKCLKLDCFVAEYYCILSR
jgi:hypothetical protein